MTKLYNNSNIGQLLEHLYVYVLNSEEKWQFICQFYVRKENNYGAISLSFATDRAKWNMPNIKMGFIELTLILSIRFSIRVQ